MTQIFIQRGLCKISTLLLYCTKPRRFNGKFTCSLHVRYLERVVFITAYVCMYVCTVFEYNVCIQRRRKRKGNSGDAPRGLSEQFRARIAESRLVAGNFPWPITASSFSVVGIFCSCFCSISCFLMPSPSHIPILGELDASGQLCRAELAQGTR